ncbi:hypothetical protein MKL26_07365, partial [Streptococcus suis]|nr:hypothetical protein [Streptococcus suis]
MISDKQNSRLAEYSYWLDSSRQDIDYPIEENRTYYFEKNSSSLDQFKVLKIEDNTSNGMQAMAIAPLIHGQPDYSQIVIAYAGTNFSDPNDRRTDLENVIQGRQGLTITPSSSATRDSQLDSALDFDKQVRATYPHAKISYTGHSLGGYLAMYLAIKTQSPVTSFNGPQSFTHLLSPEEVAWARENTDIIVNYRNSRDMIGNYGTDILGIARYVDYGDMTEEKVINYPNTLVNYYHGLAAWRTDKQGYIVDSLGAIVNEANLPKSIDIDGDGRIDINLPTERFSPRNLFLSDMPYGISLSSPTIHINSETLNQLANNIQASIIPDLKPFEPLHRNARQRMRLSNRSLKSESNKFLKRLRTA